MKYQNYFDNFLSRGLTDAVCKVLCNSVKSPVRSSKKYVCDILRICEKKNSGQKWALPISQDSTKFREHMDIRFLNACYGSYKAIRTFLDYNFRKATFRDLNKQLFAQCLHFKLLHTFFDQ